MHRGVVAVGVGALLTAGFVAFSSLSSQNLSSFFTRELFNRKPGPALPRTPEEDRALLAQRVREYWQARIQDNLERTFTYEHPARQKQLGKRTYRGRISSTIKVKEFTVLDLQLLPGAEMADVRLGAKYEYDFRLPEAKPMMVSTELTDYWQKEQGVWYHVLDLKVIPDGRPVIANKVTPQG